jgi:hypothetical protein
MTIERINSLNKIGFQWKLRSYTPRKRLKNKGVG